MKKIGFILSILIVSFGAKGQIGHFPKHKQLLTEFLAFKQDMESYPATKIDNVDSVLADFELIWWTDLETMDQYGLQKYPLFFTNNEFRFFEKAELYGKDYLMIDIFEPPTGSIHDYVLYYKRKYTHSIDELKSDTIFRTFQQMHEIKFVEDSITKPIINTIEDNSEYVKFKSDYQIHDTVLLSNRVENTNGMTFQLIYAVENLSISGPLSGGGRTISRGNQLNIRSSDLSGFRTDMFYSSTNGVKSELFKYKDYYIIKSSWNRIGNTSYYYDNTYYLKLTSPHQVDYFNELLNDSLEKCNEYPFFGFNLPSSKFLSPLKDSLEIDNGVIDSTAQYEIISYTYKNMFQPPTDKATYTNCNFMVMEIICH